MNPVITIGLVAVGIIVFNRFTTVGTASRLNYVIDSISFDTKGLLTIQVNITIGIQNPTSNGFTLQSLSGNLYLNDIYIGNASNFVSTYVEPNKETPYVVALQLSTLGLPASIADAIKNFTGIKIRLDATVNVDNLSVPAALTFNAL